MKSSVLPALVGLFVAGRAFAQTNDAAQPGQPPSNLEAGGLAPPPVVESAPTEPPPNATEQELDRADREDSGRGLEFFWLNAEIGISHLGLQSFSGDNLIKAGDADTTHTGVLYGGGLGLRMLVFTFGARFRLNNLPEVRVWTLDAEAGMHIPIGSLEPYFGLGGGYSSVGAFEGCEGCDVSGLRLSGFNLRALAGLDVYLSNTFSLGANLSGDFSFLSRPKVAAADLGTLDPTFYGKDGSGIGAGVTFSAVVGLHF